jgi:hypothetical protein
VARDILAARKPGAALACICWVTPAKATDPRARPMIRSPIESIFGWHAPSSHSRSNASMIYPAKSVRARRQSHRRNAYRWYRRHTAARDAAGRDWTVWRVIVAGVGVVQELVLDEQARY